MNQPAVEQAVQKVLSSRIYAQVLPALVQKIAVEEYQKGRKGNDLVKAVKTRLHRDWGAFSGSSAKVNPAGLSDGFDVDAVLKSHASTAERLAVMGALYGGIADVCPDAAVIWDAACALTPLSLGYMPWHVREYHAWDIDGHAIALVARYFAQRGLPALAVTADALSYRPPGKADLLFLFQFLPVAERQRKGAAPALLSLNADYIAVTLPTRSLGGHRAGIAAFNEALMDGWADASGRKVLKKEIIGHEWLYVLKGP
ncbi:MAG: hypothetical protein PHO66_02030 [Eubacteriales bacterium]|nr:hypothetical protein [Eubacteriales bacterium]